MKIRALGVVALTLLAACTETKPEAPPHRAELRQLTGNTLQVTPTGGQLPYCLLYTLSQKGVVRQLTMNRQNRSVPCTAGQPIGNVAYRVPLDEGPVRVMVLFSDQQLNAGPIAQQIFELNESKPDFSVLDIPLPGKVNAEVLRFTPTAEPPSQVGAVVGKEGERQDAGPPERDAGSLPGDAGAPGR